MHTTQTNHRLQCLFLLDLFFPCTLQTLPSLAFFRFVFSPPSLESLFLNCFLPTPPAFSFARRGSLDGLTVGLFCFLFRLAVRRHGGCLNDLPAFA